VAFQAAQLARPGNTARCQNQAGEYTKSDLGYPAQVIEARARAASCVFAGLFWQRACCPGGGAAPLECTMTLLHAKSSSIRSNHNDAILRGLFASARKKLHVKKKNPAVTRAAAEAAGGLC